MFGSGAARPSEQASLTIRGKTMLRLVLAIAIAAPLLSGCIIIATDKPTTRVVHQAPTEAQ